MSGYDCKYIIPDDPLKVLFYFFLVMFLAFAGIYLYRELEVRQFKRHGIETDASIVRLYHKTEIRRFNVHDCFAEVMYMHKHAHQKNNMKNKKIQDSRTSSGVFRFELQHSDIDPGNLISSSIYLYHEEYDVIKPGDIVKVAYLPSSPANPILKAHLHKKGQMGLLAMGLIAFLLSGFMLLFRYKSERNVKSNE